MIKLGFGIDEEEDVAEVDAGSPLTPALWPETAHRDYLTDLFPTFLM